jgi:hypothetical protein
MRGAVITEGGFPAGSADQLGIVPLVVAGRSFPGGVAPFAHDLLWWVADQIHTRVEPLHDGWNWGWNFRDVIGATVLSDHAGGVAIDINAPAHPRGVHGTWSSVEVSIIRKILAEANRDATVIVWGHDFRTTVDDMHFACRGTKAQVTAAGKRLTSTDWFDMADKADLRDVVDNALASDAFTTHLRAVVRDEVAKAGDVVWSTPLVNPLTGQPQQASTFLRYATQRLDVLRKWAESIGKATKANPPA